MRSQKSDQAATVQRQKLESRTKILVARHDQNPTSNNAKYLIAGNLLRFWSAASSEEEALYDHYSSFGSALMLATAEMKRFFATSSATY